MSSREMTAPSSCVSLLSGLPSDEAAAVEWVRCMVRDSEGKRVSRLVRGVVLHVVFSLVFVAALLGLCSCTHTHMHACSCASAQKIT